ncbi:hypothetical protein ACFL5E_01150 [Candidatus Omnitrophota bacterium]
MAGKKVYRAIVEVVEKGALKEPFTEDQFREACPGFGDGTYYAYLYKHRSGNPGGNDEFFKQVSSRTFKLLRPIKKTQLPK